MIATTLIAVGSMLVAAALLGTFVALMARVVGVLDGNYGAPRLTGVRSSAAPQSRRWTFRSDAVHRDPSWWPRFERQFAEYVDRLG